MEQIGKYKIIAKIGQGAMGEVYKAHDSALNREVAVKTISADLGSDETLRKRFEREAQSAARLNHPNIITVYDFGQQGGKLYMAMELLEGTDLRKVIANRTALGISAKLDIMEQICEGLSFAHSHGIVHRDLKPANIHLLPNGKVKIVDFGLAHISGSDMTRTGLVMGTPHYMSPEQVRGERADARSDIFAVGCVFYELLTYHKPFEADSMHAVLYKVMQEEPTPPRDLVPSIPFVLFQVIDRALAKNPDDRFQNAGELKAGLQKAREAVAVGRGDRPLPELLRPGAALPEAERSGARGATSPAARSHPGSRITVVSPPPAAPSRLPVYLGGGALVVLLLGIGAYMLRPTPQAPTQESPAAPPPQVESLARAVVDTQVEIARKKLEAGDYAEAARQAERALKLDAANKDARAIFDKAKGTMDEIATSTSEAKSASAAGDTARAAAALWRLLLVAPDDPLGTELLPGLESAFKGRAEEARKLAAAARKAAEQTRAGSVPSFAEGTTLVKEAEKAVQSQQYGTAVRGFLKARERFERSRRIAP